MEKIKTNFKDLYIIKSDNHEDSRGYLREIYKKNLFKHQFIFDYYSFSKKNVIRGMHFQISDQQDKLITVIKGHIKDFCIDLRKNSKTFLKTFELNLSAKNGMSLLIPKGFAHGFLALNKENIVLYKNSRYRKSTKEMGINIFDKDLGLRLKKSDYIVSDKDKKNLNLKTFLKKYKSL